jgi:hypothetical protein
MTRNVHRAAAVYSPHYAVLVNPPDPAVAARLRATGGGARALEWVIAGVATTRSAEGSQSVDGFIEALLQQGFPLEDARALAQMALERGNISPSRTGEEIQLPDAVRQRAQDEALSITSALELGRVSVDDMSRNTTPPLRTLYESAYPAALADARLSNVELLTSFPVATLSFGYSRGGGEAGSMPLHAFRDGGGLRSYGAVARTEGLLCQLDPLQVLRYLRQLGFELPTAQNEREARLAILSAVDVPRPTEQAGQPLGIAVATLVHSYAHRLLRTIGVTAGVERESLAEYLLPHHLSFIIYAAARGEFVLGGLQALFETGLHTVLERFAYGEKRCPLDPACSSGGGACMACLHLGEPSCRWFNRRLDRAALFGARGYMADAPAR